MFSKQQANWLRHRLLHNLGPISLLPFSIAYSRSLLFDIMRIIILLTLCALVAAASVGKRVVSAMGTVTCGSKPAENVKVRLFRVKQKKTDDVNQILDESTTGVSGMFRVEGNTNGFPLNETDIEPVITFYHTCDEDAAKLNKNGYRKFNYNVPKEYVTLGSKAKKSYDLGKINLQVEYPGETHDKKFVDKNAPKKP